MKTNKIEIEVPDGKTAKWVNGVLTLVDKKLPITERIKTFEDACEELGKDHPLVLDYKGISYLGGIKDVLAYMKLRIICAALNEGWEPKFTEDECIYYPWFCLYTKDEIEKMSKDKRKELGLWAGLSSAPSNRVWTLSFSTFSSHLCLKSKELAIYCGKQFIDIWADFAL